MYTYQIIDRGFDYQIIVAGGFYQRVPNLALLRKAVRFWRANGFKRA